MVKYVCDGCGAEAPARLNIQNAPIKPADWFVKHDDEGAWHACSRECVNQIGRGVDKDAVRDLVIPL